MVLSFAILERFVQHNCTYEIDIRLPKRSLLWWFILYMLYFDGIYGLSHSLYGECFFMTLSSDLNTGSNFNDISFIFRILLFAFPACFSAIGGFIIPMAVSIRSYGIVLLTAFASLAFPLALNLQSFIEDLNRADVMNTPAVNLLYWPLYLTFILIGLATGTLARRKFHPNDNGLLPDEIAHDVHESALYSKISLLAIIFGCISIAAICIYIDITYGFYGMRVLFRMMTVEIDPVFALAMVFIMLAIEKVLTRAKGASRINPKRSHTQHLFICILLITVFIGASSFIYNIHFGIISLLHTITPTFVRPWWETGFRIWHALIPALCSFIIVKAIRIRTFSMILCAALCFLLAFPALHLIAWAILGDNSFLDTLRVAIQERPVEHWPLFILGSILGAALAMLLSSRSFEESMEHA